MPENADNEEELMVFVSDTVKRLEELGARLEKFVEARDDQETGTTAK